MSCSGGASIRSCPIPATRCYASHICVMRGGMSGWPSKRTGRFRARWIGGGPGARGLAFLDEAAPDVRLINLETTITADGQFANGKAVCYRMHPDNLPALTTVQPDVCALANNHILDFGPLGLT